MKMPILLVALITLLGCGACAGKDSCYDCHRVMEGMSLRFTNDIHFAKSISCANCHGGDPNESNQNISMNSSRGFKVRVTRQGVPEYCGNCHSDTNVMSKYDPQLPVDQLAQYKTGVHGKSLAAGGRRRVAECVDCHSVHNIRMVDDPLSTASPQLFPRRVPSAMRPHLMRSPARGMAGCSPPSDCPAARSATRPMPPSRPPRPCSPVRLPFAPAAIGPGLRPHSWRRTWRRCWPDWKRPVPARKTPWHGRAWRCIALTLRQSRKPRNRCLQTPMRNEVAESPDGNWQDIFPSPSH